MSELSVKYFDGIRFWRRAFVGVVLHVALFGWVVATKAGPSSHLTSQVLARFPLKSAGPGRVSAILFTLSGLWVGPALAAGDVVALYLVWRLMHGRRTSPVELAYLLSVGLVVGCHIAAGLCMMRLGPVWLPQMSMMFEPVTVAVLIMLDLVAGLPAWAILYGLTRYPVPEEAGFEVKVREGSR